MASLLYFLNTSGYSFPIMETLEGFGSLDPTSKLQPQAATCCGPREHSPLSSRIRPPTEDNTDGSSVNHNPITCTRRAN